MFKFLFCKIVGHRLERAGACPFTGKVYDECRKCNKMIEVNNE
jgi:hypothetical protein